MDDSSSSPGSSSSPSSSSPQDGNQSSQVRKTPSGKSVIKIKVKRHRSLSKASLSRISSGSSASLGEEAGVHKQYYRVKSVPAHREKVKIKRRATPSATSIKERVSEREVDKHGVVKEKPEDPKKASIEAKNVVTPIASPVQAGAEVGSKKVNEKRESPSSRIRKASNEAFITPRYSEQERIRAASAVITGGDEAQQELGSINKGLILLGIVLVAIIGIILAGLMSGGEKNPNSTK